MRAARGQLGHGRREHRLYCQSFPSRIALNYLWLINTTTDVIDFIILSSHCLHRVLSSDTKMQIIGYV